MLFQSFISSIPYYTKVAQYIHFGTPVLEAFITKFNEEEEREIQKIKDRFE